MDDATLLLMATRLRATVYAAKLGTALETELAVIQREGFDSPVERDLWLSIGKGLLEAVEACLAAPATTIQ